jgi:hypothetical protein
VIRTAPTGTAESKRPTQNFANGVMRCSDFCGFDHRLGAREKHTLSDDPRLCSSGNGPKLPIGELPLLD